MCESNSTKTTRWIWVILERLGWVDDYGGRKVGNSGSGGKNMAAGSLNGG